MLYFVTGATGFVGGALVRLLRTAGNDVRALVRDPAAARALADIGVELHRGDVTDPESLRAPMRGADGVFHVAGWYKLGVRDRRAAVGVNIDGTRNVLAAMREAGVPKGVYTSSLAVNSDTHGQVVDETYHFDSGVDVASNTRRLGGHLSLYDWSKAEAHKIAVAETDRGLPLVIVQPGLIYGPGDTSGVRTTFRQYLQRKLPMIPSGAAYSWAHVDDEARGHVLAMEHGVTGRNYFLAGPVHTLVEAMKIAEGITGIPAPRVHVPPAVLKIVAGALGVVDAVAHLPPSYAPESLRVLAGVTYLGSSSRAQAELGWRARQLRDGLTETLRHEMQLLGMPANF